MRHAVSVKTFHATYVARKFCLKHQKHTTFTPLHECKISIQVEKLTRYNRLNQMHAHR